MTNRPSVLRRAGAGLRSLFGTIVGGTYLIALYLFTVWLVVGSLTAIQIREDVRNDARGDAPDASEALTFADVERSYDRHQTRISQIYSDVDQVFYEHNEQQEATNFQIETTLDTIRQQTHPALQLTPFEFEGSEQFGVIMERCELVGSTADGPCELVYRYYDLFALRTKQLQKFESSDFTELYANAEKTVAELRAAEPLARYFDIYEFFNFMPLYSEFLKEPPQILVLQLTIVMGMLGSVITMTWSFINKDSGFTFRRFLILPFVGAMSAFIIFVFVKAGQLTLTAGGASEPLNPFVLSFVGIISGLLSERAYARMSEVGSNFFRVAEDEPRYGIDLRTALEQGGVGETELAGYLKLTDEEATRLLDGKSPATSLQQQLVAACLRRAVRELFTDLPPDGAKPPSEARSPPPAAAAPSPL